VNRARELGNRVNPRRGRRAPIDRLARLTGHDAARADAWRRWAWRGGLAAAALGWYAADSLRHRREGAFGYNLASEIEVGSDDFLRAAEALTGAPISVGNRAELLVNGDRIFPAFLETIRSAERTVCVQTYVYWRGKIAAEVAEAIGEQARAGVECRVILDALGAAKMDRSLIARMREAGVEVILLRPPKPYAVRRLVNRTHRRILVADGRVGMTGGVGVAAEWEGDAQDPEHWRDTHVRVVGPVVRSLMGAFAENWLEGTGEVLAGEGYLPDLEPIEDGGRMQLVRSSAGVGDTNVEALYYLAIASAARRIELTAAYFVPRPAFVEALVKAAGRGVEVLVLVPGPHIDKGFVRVAGRAAYEELLAAGIAIHEYQPTMLHAKSLVIDGAWASVGTVNFDNRSFQLHDEVTLCVWGEEFASRLSQEFERDLSRSQRIDPERWSGRRLDRRAAETIMKVFRREL
jgi:cardiolipin synthase